MKLLALTQSASKEAKFISAFLALTFMSMFASEAYAITSPTTGSFAYDFYDIAVNKMLKGAPGFIGGIIGIVASATQLSKNWILAVLGILASTAALKADTIIASLGMSVQIFS